MNPTTIVDRVEQVVTTMTERMATLTRTLATWMLDQPHTLAEVEQQVLPLIKDLGATVVAGLCGLLTATPAAPTVACACGHQARYLQRRPATVTTILGPITLTRPWYHCAACRHGHAPLDAHFQLCPGSRSAGLDELLALLGATQDSFAEAASVLERLTLVHVSPNTVRAATEQLGAVLVATQAEQVALAQAGHADPPSLTAHPTRLYIAMDGVFAHVHERDWREIKVGCCYLTHPEPDRKHPDQFVIRAVHLSYVTALAPAATFGWHLWCEAARRGVLDADEVIVVSDGAHWIWNLASEHFPGATQILDWYHASAYIGAAASAIWAEGGAERATWIKTQLDDLWEGKVAAVLKELARHRAVGAAVTDAMSYYTTHQDRMAYAAYRARGLQIGSGSVESGCKQLVSARVKQAGMIWDAAGAEAVATVRAWLKSARWAEAMGLRPPPQRTSRREGNPRENTPAPALPDTPPPPRAGLPADVLARVRAEEAAERAVHPWKHVWSVPQQRREADARSAESAVTPTA